MKITREQLEIAAEAHYRTFIVVPNWSVNPDFPPSKAWEDLSESIQYTYASRMKTALKAIGIKVKKS